jgi:anthranilate phosphoribosyltransferase
MMVPGQTHQTLFSAMLDGTVSDAEIEGTLVEMTDRGETADEIAGAAMAMRQHMIRLSGFSGAIDVCGTGGDGSHSLNVSTAVSIVVAACDVVVAKHGNRAASSRAGAADTLEALGLNLDRASETAEATLADLGICFLFAQKYHPALGRLAPIRKHIGRRTIFNLLGPLANPAGVTRQLIGVPTPSVISIYCDALRQLGTERAIVVSGKEGLDEISISGPTHVESVGLTLPFDVITPDAFGMPVYPANALQGGDAQFNARAIRALFMGDRGAYRDAVIINAGAALVVADHVSTIADGIEEASEAIDKGLAKALLDCWIAY